MCLIFIEYIAQHMAEQGFEPWVEFPPQRFSRPSRSAAPALLRTTVLIPINFRLFNKFSALLLKNCHSR